MSCRVLHKYWCCGCTIGLSNMFAKIECDIGISPAHGHHFICALMGSHVCSYLCIDGPSAPSDHVQRNEFSCPWWIHNAICSLHKQRPECSMRAHIALSGWPTTRAAHPKNIWGWNSGESTKFRRSHTNCCFVRSRRCAMLLWMFRNVIWMQNAVHRRNFAMLRMWYCCLSAIESISSMPKNFNHNLLWRPKSVDSLKVIATMILERTTWQLSDRQNAVNGSSGKGFFFEESLILVVLYFLAPHKGCVRSNVNVSYFEIYCLSVVSPSQFAFRKFTRIPFGLSALSQIHKLAFHFPRVWADVCDRNTYFYIKPSRLFKWQLNFTSFIVSNRIKCIYYIQISVSWCFS